MYFYVVCCRCKTSKSHFELQNVKCLTRGYDPIKPTITQYCMILHHLHLPYLNIRTKNATIMHSSNMECLTHISLIVLALAVYLALELSAKLNIQGAFQYRKENMFSQVSSKILFKGLVFRCNPLSESFCIFSKLQWFAWLPFIAFQLLQDEETFSVQWFSNKYHF